MKKVIVVGGGAAGFFAAINAKEKNPDLDISILEKGSEVLQKVKISGGGRCNVTHACFDPAELTSFYPRGEKELRGPFHTFMTGDTFEWFDANGIPLKIEEDGRVFPESNSSQTIIDCFLQKTKELNIEIRKNCGVIGLEKKKAQWMVKTKKENLVCDAVVFATGSSKQAWKILGQLEHSLVPPVPSLFTFNIKDDLLTDLPGVSVPNATVSLLKTKLENSGPLLITHWGLSGPAVLKLSAFGARVLHGMNYQYQVQVNWISKPFTDVEEELWEFKSDASNKKVVAKSMYPEIPRRLWEKLVISAGIDSNKNWADLRKKELETLANRLTACVFHAQGKSTFKEEFVTAGGVSLKEINFKTFESKLHSNLFLIGEVIDIDAVTGGFNFQNAWTGGWMVSEALKGRF
ncbi:MAG: aminoacetone oxidase family FAD-binding enzyme [Flavobacteriaceae bacterium]|nr:aminoacetone oxidase family FAD-binding enzyme [Flavobacteriaceae bacterium]|tara:strand:- start:33345 stop:34559 length:1215 start_codon:yes stop_codon:yes gene_type:complete